MHRHRATRVALYSHDTQGLGHVRRNSLIAAALVDADPDTDLLLLTGAPEASALPLPPRTDLVTFPGLRKDLDGSYAARTLSASLDEVVTMREAVIEGALSAFDPDLVIVDKVALGAHGELAGPLARLRAEHQTRIVLGLREILDDPVTTTREWRQEATEDVIDRLYDAVWVYGDPDVFDPAVEYGWLESTTRKVEYTGYLGRHRSRLLAGALADGAEEPVAAPAPYVLCLVGGGQDGAALASAFVRARMPHGHTGLLVTGPYLDPAVLAELEAVAARRSDLLVRRLVRDVPGCIAEASATVSMAGYNTVCELLAAGRPALLVPRTEPRREQLIRAERLSQLGLVDVLDAGTGAAAEITGWLAFAVRRPRRAGRCPLDLDGLCRLPALAGALVDRPRMGVRRVAI